MAQYTIEIKVTARREFELPEPPLNVSTDPLTQLTKVAERFMPAAGGFPVFPLNPGSLALEKTISLRAESFAALAEIVGKFDGLAEHLEMESQAASG